MVKKTRKQAAITESIHLTEALCDIDDPILFQAVLTRLAAMLDDEWLILAAKLASLSPRSLIVVLAVGEYPLYNKDANKLHWMVRGPNPYLLKHPSMMHEVRALCLDNSCESQLTFPCLHYFTSLRTLKWHCSHVLLPDDTFSLLRQQVPHLRELDVWTPRLSVPMLRDIAHMKRLTCLKLASYYPATMPSLQNMHNLKELVLIDWNRRRKRHLVSSSTLEGLTQLETLRLSTPISNSLLEAIPNMFPLLHSLAIKKTCWSEDVVASLRSHYGEGIQLHSFL